MNEVDHTLLIDDRNRNLWNQINEEYDVNFMEAFELNYGCYTENKSVTFYIPINDYCLDSFTHELLHVYIRLKEVYIGSNIKLKISGSNVLNRIFVPNLLEHVGNCLDHIKMLPIYLAMGFNREKFIVDYYDNKCTPQELFEIKRYYKNGLKYNCKAVEIFIGKYFSIVADPNDTFDYSSSLKELGKVDPKLFSVLKDFTDSWIAYDLDNKEIFYYDLVETFYNNLKSWMTNKQFI